MTTEWSDGWWFDSLQTTYCCSCVETTKQTYFELLFTINCCWEGGTKSQNNSICTIFDRKVIHSSLIHSFIHTLDPFSHTDSYNVFKYLWQTTSTVHNSPHLKETTRWHASFVVSFYAFDICTQVRKVKVKTVGIRKGWWWHVTSIGLISIILCCLVVLLVVSQISKSGRLNSWCMASRWHYRMHGGELRWIIDTMVVLAKCVCVWFNRSWTYGVALSGFLGSRQVKSMEKVSDSFSAVNISKHSSSFFQRFPNFR